ncbi:MAG: glycosyltransferase family 39 protein [Paracraurococcus sp.]
MRRAATLPALTPAETVALSVERIAIALVLAFFLIAILISDMNGYQGSDDARYIAGAEAWLAEGVHIARNHWETRLPYVLLIAATGTTATAILALHIVLGMALIVMSWRLSRPVIGPRAAVAFATVLAMAAFTQQIAGRLQIEVLELLLAGAAFWLVRQRIGGAGLAQLVAAGVLLGLAILTRQTSAAAAIGLGLALLLNRRTADAFLLAGVAALPVLAECIFYAVMTGDPLARLQIDMRHVLVEGQPLPGGAFTQGNPLFNPTLGAAWQNSTQGLLHIHWTVDAFLRLVTYPTGLLTWIPALVLLALPRFTFAGQQPGLRRDVLIMMAAVYVVVVFVLTLAPEPRYFSMATYLAAMVLAIGLTRLTERVPAPAFLAIAGLAVAGPLAADLNPTPRPVVPQVVGLLQGASAGRTLHVSGPIEATSRLALREAGLSGRVTGAPPPAGAYFLGFPGNDALDLVATCPGGVPRLLEIARGTTSASLAWDALELLGLDGRVPAGPAAYLRRERYVPALYKVGC